MIENNNNSENDKEIINNNKELINNEEITIISTADGYIHAIDSNQQKKWSTSTGNTLISSYHNINNQMNTNSMNNRDYSIIPSIDGSLLIHNSIGMRKTSVKARMIIEKTPFLSNDGELIFTGQTKNKLIEVNINNGIIKHEIDVDIDHKPKVLTSNDDDTSESLWLGRIDYTIHAYDEKSGTEQFNLSYSEIKPLYNNMNHKLISYNKPNNYFNIKNNIKQNLINHKEKHSLSPIKSNAYSLSSGEFIYYDSNQDIQSIQLHSPASTAFRLIKNKDIRNYDIEPLKIFYRIPSDTISYDDHNIVEVKHLPNGGLYAIDSHVDKQIDDQIINNIDGYIDSEYHTPYLLTDSTSESHNYLPSLSATCKGIGSNCHTPIAVPKSNLHLIKSINKNLNHKVDKKLDKSIQRSIDLTNELSNELTNELPVELSNELNEYIDKHCIIYPNTFNDKIDESSMNVLTSNTPVCLLGKHILLPNNKQTNHLPFYQLSDSELLDLQDNTIDKYIDNDIKSTKFLNNKNYYMIFTLVIVIIFIYEKIKKKIFKYFDINSSKYIPNDQSNILHNNLPNNLLNNNLSNNISNNGTSSLSNDVSSKSIEYINEFGEKCIRIGSLVIYDKILGYGSQGTVVYKGNLNGRPVAIKRMLSQFGRVADREMSLLIRSDGHPNVVRYFLKEEHGDFIYLALQLCCMSLKDFINTITKDKEVMINEITDEIRLGLLQIAKGVLHLHIQRIVHRDLKPHNILFALSDDFNNKAIDSSLDNAIESQVDSQVDDKIDSKLDDKADSQSNLTINNINDYIIKISDMGLSKQLDSNTYDQSLSINQNNRLDQSIDRESYVGTIGWQAPEIISLRLNKKEDNLFIDESNELDSSINSQKDSKSDSQKGCKIDSSIGDNIDSKEDSSIDIKIDNQIISQKSSKIDSQKSSKDQSIQSQKVDIFSLGCIFFYIIQSNQHLFGHWYERESNILTNNPINISNLLDNNLYDFYDLITRMIQHNPIQRPTAQQIVNHPFFWISQVRLDFIVELSDRLEHESIDSNLVLAIESNATEVIGNSWDRRLPIKLLEDIDKYRKYDKSCIRDLLRLIRNKRHHFLELDQELRQLMSPMPNGFIHYFETKFPKLLIHCVSIVCKYLSNDRIFHNYCDHITSLFICNDSTNQNLTIHSTVTNNSINNSAFNSPNNSIKISTTNTSNPAEENVIIWFGSQIADKFNNQGWYRDRTSWTHGIKFNHTSNKNNQKSRPIHLTKASNDFRYRSRLCNHWETTRGTICPMRKKGKCDFAHGPLELRIKDTRRDRWGKPPQPDPSTISPIMTLRLSGGEDVLGVARQLNNQQNYNQQPQIGYIVMNSMKMNQSPTSFNWGNY